MSSANEIILQELSSHPCDLPLAIAALLRNGWAYPNAVTDAAVALDELVEEGRAEKRRGIFQIVTKKARK